MSNSINDQVVVSICCVTYNHENYIRQCLDGFLIQKTDFQFEVLVHEDASTDSTASIVREYEQKYPAIFRCVYQTENQFKKQNVLDNILFKMARGKYIALCEGDDYWTDPLKLQKQVNVLETNANYSWCIHNAIIKYEAAQSDRLFCKHSKSVFKLNDVIGLGGGFFPTCSLFFRADCLPMPPFFQKIKSGDFALVLIFSLRGDGFYSPDIMSTYRIHSNGVFTSLKGQYNKRIEIDEDNIKLLNFFNEFSEYKYEKRIQDVIINHYALIVRRPLVTGNYKETFRLFKKYWNKMTVIVRLRAVKDILKISFRNELKLKK